MNIAVDNAAYAAASAGGIVVAGVAGPLGDVSLLQFALVSVAAWAGVVARLASEASERRKKFYDGEPQSVRGIGFDLRALGYDSMTAPVLGNLAVASAIGWGFTDGYILFAFAMGAGYTGTQIIRWAWDTARTVIAKKLGVAP